MSKDKPRDESRRKFLKGLGATVVGVIAADNLLAAQDKPSSGKVVDLRLPPPDPEDHLLVMQHDLLRALQKPVSERKWGMVIDLRKCVGCSACTVGCIAENNLPPGVVYRPVMEETIGTYPNVSRRFRPRPCMHCDNPPCVPVCPVKATYKRDDGIVVINYNQCIGCRYCLTACPYGARTFDFGEFYTDGTPTTAPYEEKESFEYGRRWKRRRGIIATEKPPVGNVRKCHFCLHRIENGLLPTCVTTCIGRATYFGDLNDSQALVSRLASLPNTERLKEDLGTEPKVIYVV